jgi:hypothetical protein
LANARCRGKDEVFVAQISEKEAALRNQSLQRVSGPDMNDRLLQGACGIATAGAAQWRQQWEQTILERHALVVEEFRLTNVSVLHKRERCSMASQERQRQRDGGRVRERREMEQMNRIQICVN